MLGVCEGVTHGLHFHLRQFSALLKAARAVLKIVLLICSRRLGRESSCVEDSVSDRGSFRILGGRQPQGLPVGGWLSRRGGGGGHVGITMGQRNIISVPAEAG